MIIIYEILNRRKLTIEQHTTPPQEITLALALPNRYFENVTGSNYHRGIVCRQTSGQDFAVWLVD